MSSQQNSQQTQNPTQQPQPQQQPPLPTTTTNPQPNQPQSKTSNQTHQQNQSQKLQQNQQQQKQQQQQQKQKQKQHQQQKQQKQKQKEEVEYKEEIPDKFYDSDLASVNQKDFLSDNQPPKDIVHQRKLLHKEKKLHIYKTIVKVGFGIDKPAPYDQIKLRFKSNQNTSKQGVQQSKNPCYLSQCQFLTYNLGKSYPQIQKLVTSMKKNETALFQLQWLEVSKKSNIKVLKQKQIYVIQVEDWTTAIDIDGNSQVLKYLVRRGEGPYRVSKFDQVVYDLGVWYKGTKVVQEVQRSLKVEQEDIQAMQPIVWKVMSTMKRNQLARVTLSDQNMRLLSMKSKQNHVSTNTQDQIHEKQQKPIHIQPSQKYKHLLSLYQTITKTTTQIPTSQIPSSQPVAYNPQKPWQLSVQIKSLINIDDIYMNGEILKKTLIKGVSTAKPDSSSLIYYALKYLDSGKKVLHQDQCFCSDWWEDFGKLDILGCRKMYMDQYKMSKFLKVSMKRMKPAEVAELQCRNMEYFQYGHDYEELQKLWPKDQQFPPKRVYIVVRVYNFTQGKNCFNMTIDQKIQQSKRKKAVAIKLLSEGNLKKSYKKFQNIISFYNSGDINQNAYDEKISALMNSILCLMKQNKYAEMVPLCNIVLEKPKHGFNQDKMKLNAQGIKVEGNVKNQDGDMMDEREAADLDQNPKIIQKCLFRKALALCKLGENKQALQCLNKIESPNQQVLNLKAQAQKKLQIYQDKSKKIFKSMFGS